MNRVLTRGIAGRPAATAVCVQPLGILPGGEVAAWQCDSVKNWEEVLLPEIEKKGKVIVFRSDAAFAKL